MANSTSSRSSVSFGGESHRRKSSPLLIMKPFVEFEEAVRDSPKFRGALEDQFIKIDNLDGKLEKLLKSSHHMIESGKSFLNAQQSFFNSLTECSAHFREDGQIHNAFSKCSQGLAELAKFQSTLLDQINRAICRNLTDFLKREVRSCKEMKIYFEKLQLEYDNLTVRNSSLPMKSKTNEVEEIVNHLNGSRVNYRSAAIELVYSITLVQQRKRFEILDNILAVMNAHKTYFHQGSDFFKDSDHFYKNLNFELSDMRTKVGKDSNVILENRESLIHTTTDYILNLNSTSCVMQGYLFKRSSNKAFKTWKRRWFELLNRGQLNYRKKSDDLPIVMEDDLRICLVRPMADCDRRFCFELISPNKIHILQADNEEVFKAWVQSLQGAISSAIHNSTMTRKDDYSPPNSRNNQEGAEFPNISPEKSKVLQCILRVKGNDQCCDCGMADPEWASVNLGITLCIECSGIHRSLGVHYSKVRSIKLDTWETGVLKVMGELGNNLVNRVYMAKAEVLDTFGVEKATPDCSREIRETYIRAKYIDKCFVSNPKLNENMKGRKVARRWSVCKPYRRQRKKSASDIGGEKIISEETESELSSLSIVPPDDSVSSECESFKSSRQDNSSTSGESEASVLVFGSELLLLPPTSTDIVPSHLLTAADDDEMSADDEDDKVESSSVENLDANMLLFKASRVANLGVMLEACALGANKNFKNLNEEGTSCLHQAILGGSVTACEFLLLNGANINIQDSLKRTPLWLATKKGHTGQVCLLLRNRADHHIPNIEGETPLDIGIISEHADIVTLLRLAQLDEEMRLGDQSSQADESFQDIVRDIQSRAQDDSIDGSPSPIPPPLPTVPSPTNNNQQFVQNSSPTITLN